MLTREEDVLTAAESWREAGRDVAIATVVETWGSAPRPVGSHLVIDSEGNFLGSVSGGCVEGAVVEEAAEVIANGRAAHAGVRRRRRDGLARRTFLRGPDQGLCREADLMRLDVLKAMNAARGERRAGAMVTRLSDGEQRFVGPKRRRRSPRRRIGGGVCAWAKARPSRIEGEEYFLTVQAPSPRLTLIGAVHISQALAPIARIAGLDVSIIDPRTAFATPERFPDTPIVAKWPDEALAEAPLDRFTAICLLTHDPKIDDPALMIALKADCFYIGALGSRKTHAKRIERMRARGFDEAALARIHAPIGLDIGAVSPAEIAVSIMGEIVASLRKKPLRAESAAA